MIQIDNLITADEGRIFRRISDGQLSGKEIYLGWEFPPGEHPYEAKPEDYEEIDEPITEDTPLLTEEEPLTPTEEELATLEELEGEPLPEEPLRRITYSDYLNLQKEVEQLKKAVYGETNEHSV